MIWLLLFLIMVFVVRMVIVTRSENRAIRQRLDGDTIFDPETAHEITLEQAEHGYMENEVPMKSTPFQLAEQEIAMIKVELKKNLKTSDPLRVIEILENSEMLSRYHQVEVNDVYAINDRGQIGMLSVVYEDLSGHTIESVWETQLFLLISNYTKAAIISLSDQFEREMIDDYLLIKSSRIATRSDLIKLTNFFSGYMRTLK